MSIVQGSDFLCVIKCVNVYPYLCMFHVLALNKCYLLMWWTNKFTFITNNMWWNIFINVHLLVYHISKQHQYLPLNFLKVQCDFNVCAFFFGGGGRVNSCLLCVCIYHIFTSQNTADSHCRWLLLHIFTYVIFMWYVTPLCCMWPFICLQMYNMYYPVHTFHFIFIFHLFSCSCNLQQAPQRAIRYRTGQRYMDTSIK